LRILPVAVCGISVTKATSSGTAHFARRSLKKSEELLLLRPPSVLGHHHQQRALRPFGMRQADDRRLLHVGMPHRRVLHVDGADPLAARLDHVLPAIDDLQIAVGVDGADVAGAEPAPLVVGLLRRLFVPEIGADDPGPAHQELATGDAVVGLCLAVGVHQLHLDAIE